MGRRDAAKTALVIRWTGGGLWSDAAYDPENGDKVYEVRFLQRLPGRSASARADLARALESLGYRMPKTQSSPPEVRRMREARGGPAS